MTRWLIGFALSLSLVGSVAVPAPNDKKKPDEKKEPPATPDADMLPPGQFAGKLKTTPASDGSFVVDLEYQHLELKPGQNPNPKNANPQVQRLIRDQQRIAQLQNQLATARTQQQAVRTLQQLQNAMNQYQQHQLQGAFGPQAQQQQSPYVVKTDHKEFTFHAADDMKVRFSKPPAAFDAKGNFRELKDYTPEELKELKGTGDEAKLEGFKGSLDKLVSGMQVKVTTALNRPKLDDKKKDAAPADKKDDAAAEKKDPAPADKKDDMPKDGEKKDPGPKTLVKVIVVLGDDMSGAGNDTPMPKKKKKD